MQCAIQRVQCEFYHQIMYVFCYKLLPEYTKPRLFGCDGGQNSRPERHSYHTVALLRSALKLFSSTITVDLNSDIEINNSSEFQMNE